MGSTQRLMEKFYDRFNAGDFDGAEACFQPDVSSAEPGIGEMEGSAAWRAHGEDFKRACPDARLNLVSIIEDGNKAVIEGRFTGTQTGPLASPNGELPPSGRKIDLPFVEVNETVDGRIATHRIYYDQVVLLTQLGLMPAE
jgi:steroid delta-isomerase-like uncharacterized protein